MFTARGLLLTYQTYMEDRQKNFKFPKTFSIDICTYKEHTNDYPRNQAGNKGERQIIFHKTILHIEHVYSSGITFPTSFLMELLASDLIQYGVFQSCLVPVWACPFCLIPIRIACPVFSRFGLLGPAFSLLGSHQFSMWSSSTVYPPYPRKRKNQISGSFCSLVFLIPQRI